MTRSFQIPDWPVRPAALSGFIAEMMDDGSWGRYDEDWTERLGLSLAAAFGQSHVHLCCSGTVATEIALRGLGVSSGQSVVLGSYDFPGNFRAIEAVGAIPVLADVQPGGWTIDYESLERGIMADTSAIIVTHLHGQLAVMPRIMELARVRGLKVVEDCCQVPGAKIGDRAAGSFGDVATLSFGGSKLLTSGRGGAAMTNDPAIARRMRVFVERGNDTYPLSQLQAACVLAQLDELKSLNEKRNGAAHWLVEKFAQELPALTLTAESIALSALYKFPILLNESVLAGVSRDQLIGRFREAGIPLDEGFRGFHLRSVRRCRKPVELLHTRAAAERTLLLHHPALLMENQELDSLAEAIVRGLRQELND